jgi:hypothetical protein
MISHLQTLYEEPGEMFGADPLASAKVWLAAMETSIRRTVQQATQQPAELADARAWLAAMEFGRAAQRTTCTSGEAMMGKRNAEAAQQPKSPTVRKSQSLQDQQFEERRRIAEHLVQALREAGYSCDLADSGEARTLRGDN